MKTIISKQTNKENDEKNKHSLNTNKDRRKDISFNVDMSIDVDSVQTKLNKDKATYNNDTTNNKNDNSIKGLKSCKLSYGNLISTSNTGINKNKTETIKYSIRQLRPENNKDNTNNTSNQTNIYNIKYNNSLKNFNTETTITHNKVNNKATIKSVSKEKVVTNPFDHKIYKDGYLLNKNALIVDLDDSKKLKVPNASDLLVYKIRNNLTLL